MSTDTVHGHDRDVQPIVRKIDAVVLLPFIGVVLALTSHRMSQRAGVH